MSRWAAGIVFLFLLGGQAVGQRKSGRASNTVTGLLIVEDSSFQNQFEVNLMNGSDHPVATVMTHSQERFTFSGVEQGIYYIVADVSGFKPVRERVDFLGEDREASLSVVLEPQRVVLTKGSPLGDNLVTNVSRMAQPPALLKELAVAEKKLHEGSVADARPRLESIVVQAPDFYDGHRLLAMAYQVDKRYREAEKEYRIAQNLNPASPAPWVGLGSIYLEQLDAGVPVNSERLKETRDAFLQAIKLDPGIAFAHYLLGVTYSKLLLYQEAEGSLVRALELEPFLGSARLALANVYIRTEDWPRALAQVDFYIKENPRAPDRAQVLAKRSQIDRMTAGEGLKQSGLR